MPYDQYQLQVAPPWLQGPVGENWLTAFGIMKDALVEGAIAAVKCRWADVAPEDALPHIGNERGLDQLPTETVGAYRARLRDAWTAWEYAGTKTGILSALALLGFSAVTLRENVDWMAAPSPGYGFGDEWWRWWLIVDEPHPYRVSWFVGDGTLVGDPGKIVGITPLDVYAAMAKSIRTWRAAHAILVNITIVLSGRIVGGAPWTIGDGSTIGATTVVTAV